MSLKLPPTIHYALERITTFVNQPYKFGYITYSRPGKPRLMRSERRESLQNVLTVLVQQVDLVTGRIIRPLGRDKDCPVYADCSLNWLAEAAGVSHRTLCRVIVDLESVGWLKRESQTVTNGPEPGTLAVATVIRRLTSRFFAALGLTKALNRDREYLQANRNSKTMRTLFRIVCAGAKAALRKPTAPAKSIQVQLAELTAWTLQQQSPSPG